MKSDKKFANTLSDKIRHRGAMGKLISDRAQVENSNKFIQMLCSLFIYDWQSKTHERFQKHVE